MSARTILNPPVNTTLNALVAQPVYSISIAYNFDAGVAQTISFTFAQYFASDDSSVLFVAFPTSPLLTCALGSYVSNPTTNETTVSFNCVSAVGVSGVRLYGIAITCTD
jgi:hypothetical protein